MQKKIVALALAGLSTAAFAQIAPQNDAGPTSVTIYGVADVSVQGVHASGGTQGDNVSANGGKSRIESNSSLIGFKGVESLGNGNSAIFQLETTVNLTGANNGTANGDRSGSSAVNVNGRTTADGQAFGVLRDSGVGFASKYGTGIAGYWSTPYRQTVATMDVMPGAAGDGRIDNIFGRTAVRSGTSLTGFTRATAVAYALPTLYGINGSIAYTGQGSNNLTDNNTAGFNQALSLNLGWTGYGFNPQFAFSQMKLVYPNTTSTDAVTSATVSNSAAQSMTNYVVGGSYTGVPGLKVSALYGRNSIGVNATTVSGVQNGAAKMSNNSVYLGTSYRFGNNEPRISWQLTSNSNGATAGSTSSTDAFTQNGGKQWALGWGYYLSKRTQVYGLYTQINQNANANYTFANAPVSSAGALNGVRQQTYGAGLRTNF